MASVASDDAELARRLEDVREQQRAISGVLRAVARSAGIQPVLDEVVEAAARGTLREVWGTGTAAVISPVGELSYQDRRIVINGGRIGELTQRLYDTIVSIQYGLALEGIAAPVQYMITGGVLLTTVVIDAVTRRTQKTAGRA